MAGGREFDAETRKSARRAFAEVVGFGEVEGNTIHAVILNQELNALRDLTLGVRCGRCRQGIAWAALDANAAFVAVFQRRRKPRERRGGIEDCYEPEPPSPMGRENWPWILLAESGKTSVTVEDIHTPGYPLRLRFTCPKCGAQYLNKNTTRLWLFLDAVTHGESKIILT
jgi:hypothetical protein